MDLSRFRPWYAQAGTPRLTVTDSYASGEYHLTVTQQTPPTPGQKDKQPVMIPLAMALLDGQGNPMPLEKGAPETVLVLTEASHTFTFSVPERPVPSLLRGFSAPVQLDYAYDELQLGHLLAHDSDGFCRWDAAQRLWFGAIERLVAGESQAEAEAQRLSAALGLVLDRAAEDPAATAQLLTLPSETTIADRYAVIPVEEIHHARSALRSALGDMFAERWWQMVEQFNTAGDYRPLADDMGSRSLRHQALGYLAAAHVGGVAERLREIFEKSDNMTDQLGALRLLVWHKLDGAEDCLASFAEQWRDEALVLDQWFAVQAAMPGEQSIERVTELLGDARFDWRLPNRVRALVGTFVGANPTGFNAASGAGYALFTNALGELDRINPQVAARLAGAAARLPRLPAARASMLRGSLDELRRAGCSANLEEVLARILSPTDVD